MEHKLSSSTNLTYEGALKAFFLTGLLAGTLDGIGAIVVYRTNPVQLFQFVASGAFGSEIAFSGGIGMMLLGIFFHYFIAFFWTALFFFSYPALRILRKNRYITGLLYGVFVWIIMNRIVIPLSQIPQGPFNLKGALIGASILMVMIGLPISILTHRYYSKKDATSPLKT